MSYSVFILQRAQKELSDIPTRPFERIGSAIRALAESPRPTGCLKLTGREGWRLRVGDYRIVYELTTKDNL